MQKAKVVSSGGYVIEQVLQTHAGTLISCFGYHKGAATAWLQLHESATPADTDVPLHTFAIAAEDNFSMIIPVSGLPFSRALTAILSTTADTLTTAASLDVWITATLDAN